MLISSGVMVLEPSTLLKVALNPCCIYKVLLGCWFSFFSLCILVMTMTISKVPPRYNLYLINRVAENRTCTNLLRK